MGALSTILSLLGLAIAIGSLLLLGHVSGFSSGGDLELLAASIVAFLVGIFLFGWGLGKRTQY